MKNRDINLSGSMLVVMIAVLVSSIFLIYLGYDWYAGYTLDPNSQNTVEAGDAFRGTVFVLGLLLIAFYKIRKNEKIAEIQRNAPGTSPKNITSMNNAPANIAINVILVIIAVIFAVGSLPFLVWGIMPLID